MKKILISALLLSILPFIGCKKPEVIPAPSSSADLKIHFDGIINGSSVEWTKNVSGYAAVPSDTMRPYIDPVTMVSYLRMSYFCSMKSNSKVSYIAVGIGSLLQDPTLGTRPNDSTFNAFINANLMPPLSDTAKAGFEVRWMDENGRLFRSDDASPGTAVFSDIEQKEDASGKYTQFKCTFGCVLKHHGKKKLPPYTDSVYATAIISPGAVLTGYFKR